jgi:hypothetical protein
VYPCVVRHCGCVDTECARHRVAPFLPLQLRMKAVYDIIDGGLDPEQCLNVSETCRPQDVVVPGNTVYNQIRARMDWAAQLFRDSLLMKPVQVPMPFLVTSP